MNLIKNLFFKKEPPIRSYQDFWRWFSTSERKFFKIIQEGNNINEDFFELLSPKLNELREGYFFLCGMLNANTAELIITADGDIRNIVFVEELVAAAPQLANWRFTALKPALDIEDVTIQMEGITFSKDNLFFCSNSIEKYPDEIDLSVVHAGINNENREAITNGIYIFLDNYLGELDFAVTIDVLSIIAESEARADLVSIEKLKSFLIWRQKEFVEKYSATRRSISNDTYAGFEMQLDNGKPVIAVINKTLLGWDAKASHPWILRVDSDYGNMVNGMPDEVAYKLLERLEDELTLELKDIDGYLNLGRETGDGRRTVYFACNEFRRSSKVADRICAAYKDRLAVKYSIYKDKYWQTFSKFGSI